MGVVADPESQTQRGVFFALLAYGAWGVVPIFWKLLLDVPVIEVISHRVIWSLVFFAIVSTALLIRRDGKSWADILSPRKVSYPVLALSACLVTLNWSLYIYAVTSGRVLQGSLGYYINPLFNFVLGSWFLGESLSRLRKVAISMAAIALLPQFWAVGEFPWLSLALGGTFATYGLVRKLNPVDPLIASTIETLLMTPVALAVVMILPATHFGISHPGESMLMILGGVVTGAPLLWFVLAARNLKLSTLGFFQYISPSLQFLLAVFAYGEEFKLAHGFTFGLIWLALVFVSLEGRWARER